MSDERDCLVSVLSMMPLAGQNQYSVAKRCLFYILRGTVSYSVLYNVCDHQQTLSPPDSSLVLCPAVHPLDTYIVIQPFTEAIEDLYGK